MRVEAREEGGGGGGGEEEEEEEEERAFNQSQPEAFSVNFQTDANHHNGPAPPLAQAQPRAYVTDPATSLAVQSLQQQSLQSADNNSNQSSSVGSARLSSILRPSIEVVASELSKKHLNLANDYWRAKQVSSTSSNANNNSNNQHSPPQGDVQDPSGTSWQEPGAEREQEIRVNDTTAQSGSHSPVPSTGGPTPNGDGQARAGASAGQVHLSTSTWSPSSGSNPARELHPARDHYLHIDALTVPDHASRNRSPNGSRRRKTNARMTVHSGGSEESDLFACQAYLRRHGSSLSMVSGQSKPAGFAGSASNLIGQQLPCSCELRLHFNQEYASQWWLNCDNVQLIGSHFYLNSDANNRSQDVESEQQPDLYRFSQRASGLQIIHSQKFHHLQLSKLRSIDFSANRIRLIKVDAFHGLELTLEELDLSENLLGDSRTIFDGSLYKSLQNNDTSSFESAQTSSIFSNDELSRLKRLKWLSLRNNLISHLSANIFTRPQASSSEDLSSQLVHLDLSDNLLRYFPSDSVRQLGKLETLNLARNKISRLDQSSKFPSSLRYLDLSQNLIKTIRHCDLIDLAELLELNLSHNQLSYLDKTAFISATSASANKLILPTSNLADLEVSHRGRPWVGEGGRLTVGALSDSSESQLDLMDTREQVVAAARRVQRQVDSAEANENSGPQLELPDGDHDHDNDHDLKSEESILSSLTGLLGTRQSLNGELNLVQHLDQFNLTRKLNLSHNFFEYLPGDTLLKFANLHELDLSYNRIRKLDSNYLCSIYNLVENLRKLDLRGNLMTMLQTDQRQLNKVFGCLQRLERLSLSSNRLGSAALVAKEIQNQAQFLTSNEEYEDSGWPTSRDPLVLGERLILKFGDAFASKYLSALDLSDNQLRSMPIIEQSSSTGQLQVRQLQQTNDSESNQSRQPNQHWVNSIVYLDELNLSYNYIERLEEHEFEHLFNLRRLLLDNNKVTSLPASLMGRFTSLEVLSLSANRLANLAPLDQLLERSVKSLRVLNLANNRLTEWPHLLWQSEATRAGRASDGTSLPVSSGADMLGLSEQRSGQLLSFALEELNLEGNFLTTTNVSSLFEQLAYMKLLKVLNLSHNLLTRIKSEWFKFANKSLRKLLLAGNKINSIDLGSFAFDQINELTLLNLDSNHLKELKRKTFDSLPKLRELSLANNLIHTINSETFNQLSSLQILSLSHNKLTSWKCEYFAGLCNSISGNINADMSSLMGSGTLLSQAGSEQQVGTGASLAAPVVSQLVELDLSHNSLSQLRANSIAVHTKLIKLDLSHNKLSFIPQDLFKATTSSNGRPIQLVSSLRYLSLAHNRIQTVDNINLRPLRNLLSLDLNNNELQTLGLDVVTDNSKRFLENESANRRLIVSGDEDDLFRANRSYPSQAGTGRSAKQQVGSQTIWPALGKLRYLNLAHNQLTQINQSLLAELSPFVLLNLNLAANYLDSESLPFGFYTKVSGSPRDSSSARDSNYDMVFTLKLESLDLSHNRLNEFPAELLNKHFTSMEACNLSHNRIQNLVANSNLMIHIKSLNLQFNPLSRQSSELVLFEQRSVRYLNLAATRLYAIQQFSALSDASGLTNLQYKHRLANQTSHLDLIRSISKPIDAPYLRHLNLSSNQLVWLSSNVFDKMHSLQILDLSNNQLTRLHLLNNQLMHVSPTMEYLNLASNLFTSIDSSDFTQLSRLRYLDLSNLLSLHKLNCKFLTKLGSLKTLKMINYPSLRLTLSNHNAALQQNGTRMSDRLANKLRDELVMSTLGKHCFLDEPSLIAESQDLDQHMPGPVSRWLDIEDLEVELFNNFKQQTAEGSFKMDQELSQLLGPKTHRLVITGLNLTSISDESLLGLTSVNLKLKISYTSLSQLPLKQILNCVSKKTKLYLDFRSNNIRTIETKDLQLLDELQVGDQLLHKGDHSTLKLGSNPIRCDCQTRPLWLWLNQRLGSIDVSHLADDPAGETGGLNYASSLVKFNSLSQNSDLKCYYPLKLRDKLTQHIYYNDLVCKGSGSSHKESARRRNETTRSNSPLEMTETEEVEDEDDLDSTETKLNQVHLTKFNKYPTVPVFNSSLLLSSVMTPGLKDLHESQIFIDTEIESNRIGKRDQNSVDSTPVPIQQQRPSIGYTKHRPNTHQKHAHFNTLSAFGQLPAGRNLVNSVSSTHVAGKHSILTDSDVVILTFIAAAMSIMSIIIIAICLFKYKMDQSDHERILTTQSKFMLSPALVAGDLVKPELVLSSHQADQSQADKASPSSAGSSPKSRNHQQTLPGSDVTKLRQVPNGIHQLLVPAQPPTLLPQGQNFLMRSPTIRRMHGLATNASDWFKVTLQSYPTNQRRRLFLAGQRMCPASAQLTTSKLIGKVTRGEVKPSPEVVCPMHGYQCLTSEAQGCKYCTQIRAMVEQTQLLRVANINPQVQPSRAERSNKRCCAENAKVRPDTRPSKQAHKLRGRPVLDKKALNSTVIPCDGRVGSTNTSRVLSTRDISQAKPLRTFGFVAKDDQAIAVNREAPSSGQAATSLKSEIPTVDVEGKFTYQTESQLDSPIQPSDAPVSPSDIFILVHESSGGKNGKQLQNSTENHIEILRLRSDERPSSTMDTMQDECSHSSSPVAYGFMRSSPSATTISSVANNEQFCRNVKSGDWQAQEGDNFMFRFAPTKLDPKLIVESNNNECQQVSAKQLAFGKELIDENGNSSCCKPIASEEQMIVSRL